MYEGFRVAQEMIRYQWVVVWQGTFTANFKFQYTTQMFSKHTVCVPWLCSFDSAPPPHTHTHYTHTHTHTTLHPHYTHTHTTPHHPLPSRRHNTSAPLDITKLKRRDSSRLLERQASESPRKGKGGAAAASRSKTPMGARRRK